MSKSLFECKEAMPPKDNSPDVERTALTMPEARRNMTNANIKLDHDVEHVERPRFGHAV